MYLYQLGLVAQYTQSEITVPAHRSVEEAEQQLQQLATLLKQTREAHKSALGQQSSLASLLASLRADLSKAQAAVKQLARNMPSVGWEGLRQLLASGGAGSAAAGDGGAGRGTEPPAATIPAEGGGVTPFGRLAAKGAACREEAACREGADVVGGAGRDVRAEAAAVAEEVKAAGAELERLRAARAKVKGRQVSGGRGGVVRGGRLPLAAIG